MAKAPPKLFKVGEVMEHTGLSRQTIHNYALLGLIRSKRRTKSGHRLFEESVFDALERIKELKAADHTLDEIRRLFAANPGGSATKS